MGTFLGHALPGTFFISFAVWWTVQLTRRQMVCCAEGVHFYNTVTYPCFSMTLPLEGGVKLLASLAGMLGEAYAASAPLRDGGHPDPGQVWHGLYVGDLQHITMYTFFMLSGIADILINRKCRLIPEGLDYITAALAFLVEAILFRFHLHGRDELDIALHTFLLYAVVLCVISVLLEYKYQNSVYVGLARVYVTFLQGTWFYQAGFILYPPLSGMSHWSGDLDVNVMLVSVVFAWHIAGVLMAMFTIAGLTYCISNRCSGRWPSSRGKHQWRRLPGFVQIVSHGDSDTEQGSAGEEVISEIL